MFTELRRKRISEEVKRKFDEISNSESKEQIYQLSDLKSIEDYIERQQESL